MFAPRVSARGFFRARGGSVSRRRGAGGGRELRRRAGAGEEGREGGGASALLQPAWRRGPWPSPPAAARPAEPRRAGAFSPAAREVSAAGVLADATLAARRCWHARGARARRRTPPHTHARSVRSASGAIGETPPRGCPCGVRRIPPRRPPSPHSSEGQSLSASDRGAVETSRRMSTSPAHLAPTLVLTEAAPHCDLPATATT